MSTKHLKILLLRWSTSLRSMLPLMARSCIADILIVANVSFRPQVRIFWTSHWLYCLTWKPPQSIWVSLDFVTLQAPHIDFLWTLSAYFIFNTPRLVYWGYLCYPASFMSMSSWPCWKTRSKQSLWPHLWWPVVTWFLSLLCETSQ